MKTKTDFETKAQAIDSGFVQHKPGKIQTIGDFEIWVVDLGGTSEFGYNYGVKIFNTTGALIRAAQEGRDVIDTSKKIFCQTVTVWISGKFLPMFRQDEFAAGVAAAVKWCEAHKE